MSSIANNLKVLRKLNGMTQASFGEQFNIKRCSVGAYEENRAEPSIGDFLDFCKFYNINPFVFYSVDLTAETADNDEFALD